MSNVDPEVLLHPVRIKILTALAAQDSTPHDIAAIIGDLPKASLYRHINILRAIGAIREVREYRVRGTFEKVYALVTDTGPLAGLGPAPASQIAERLRRMIQPDEETISTEGAVWRKTATLTTGDVSELETMIDNWLRGRIGKPGTQVEITVKMAVGSVLETKA